MSGAFDIGKFKQMFEAVDESEYARAVLVMARAAENAERFEDMCEFMKHLVEKQRKLDVTERNLLSVAYKNVIGTRRGSWRNLAQDQGESPLASTYKGQIEKELKTICDEVLKLLKDILIPQSEKSGDDNSLVFYKKMAADYLRYLAECIQSEEYKDAAEKYYSEAMEKAQECLSSTNPIRLGLALNYSVCLYEIKKLEEKACELAKSAFDSAISDLDKLDECDYKDSTLIMQLLRDNLTLWSSNLDDDNDDEAN